MARRKRHSRQEAALRLQLSREAARLMAEDGVAGVDEALQRAARRLGADSRDLPEPHEVEAALALHHELFKSDTQPQELHELRQQARRAIRMLASFEPRLVGRVLEGSADRHTPIQLQLFADRPEAVGIQLHEHHIPYHLDERRIKAGREERRLPLYRFHAGEVRFELLVCPQQGPRLAPPDPSSGRPMAWADLERLERLLEEEGPAA